MIYVNVEFNGRPYRLTGPEAELWEKDRTAFTHGLKQSQEGERLAKEFYRANRADRQAMQMALHTIREIMSRGAYLPAQFDAMSKANLKEIKGFLYPVEPTRGVHYPDFKPYKLNGGDPDDDDPKPETDPETDPDPKNEDE